MQIVIATDGCGVSAAATRVALFVRRERKAVATVFLAVLVMVVFATGASFAATAALGLIGFVPFFALAVLPLQLLAWLLRGLVFQYIGLASVCAYVKLYRAHCAQLAAAPIHLHDRLHQIPVSHRPPAR
jgi:hypothetical protein